MAYVFGPVPSRRLGLSLGVDLLPYKTCTFDCLYCQLGKTTSLTTEPASFVSVSDVIHEIRDKLKDSRPDSITLGGSGEPTLHFEIDKIIALIKNITDTRIALLTNGSLLYRDDVRTRVMGADVILPTLSTAFDDTFMRIHGSHPELQLSRIIDGLIKLRSSYKGYIYLEIMLLAGINDSEKELMALKKVVDTISPDKIQLNTVIRPPNNDQALPLDIMRLEDIKKIFGDKTEIIAEISSKNIIQKNGSLRDILTDMLIRRPLTSNDIANSLHITMAEVEALAGELLHDGKIRKQNYSGNIFFLINE